MPKIQWRHYAEDGMAPLRRRFTPLERKGQEPRWRLAVCLAGLLHDIGKPVSDLSILDREGNTQWNPYLENLTDWATKHNVDRYFLRWRDKRHQRHEQFSVLVAERVLTPDCLSYLTQPGPEIMQAMLEAIAGVDRGGILHSLVIEADRKIVERDLKANHIPVDSSLGVPVEKYLLDAMRRLTGNGHWTANTRGSRVWRFRDGLHVVWKTGAQEVCELLAKDRYRAYRATPTPWSTSSSKAGCTPKTTEDGRTYRYWRMMPGGMDISLYMLRLASPELIYSGEPPLIVEGRSLEESDKDNAQHKEDAQPSAKKPEASQGQANSKQPERDTSLKSAAEMQPATLPVSPTSPVSPVPLAKSGLDFQAGQGNAQSGPLQARSGQSIAIPAKPEQDKASVAVEFAPQHIPSPEKPIIDKPGSGSGNKQTKPVNAKSANSDGVTVEIKPVGDGDAVTVIKPADPEPSSNNQSASDDTSNAAGTKDEKLANRWLSSQGPAGEWLRAAIAAHQTPPAVAVRVVDGLVFIPHPDMALKLGRKPSESLELLDRVGWIEADIRTPMRKLREIDGIRGLMLTHEASRCCLALAGGSNMQPAQARPTSTADGEPPAAARGTGPKANDGNAGALPTSKPTSKPVVVDNPLPKQDVDGAKPAMPVKSKPAVKLEAPPETPHPDQPKPAPALASKPTPPSPLDRDSETGAADTLVRLVREGADLPCPVTEADGWLSVPYSILDWHVGGIGPDPLQADRLAAPAFRCPIGRQPHPESPQGGHGMKTDYDYHLPWRPNFEARALFGWVAGAGLAWIAASRSGLPFSPFFWLIVFCGWMALYRLPFAVAVWYRKHRLRRFKFEYLDVDRLARTVRKHPDRLWFGWGFDWGQRHAQLAYEHVSVQLVQS